MFTCTSTYESKHTCQIVAKFYDALRNIAKFGVINEVNFALTRLFWGISAAMYHRSMEKALSPGNIN